MRPGMGVSGQQRGVVVQPAADGTVRVVDGVVEAVVPGRPALAEMASSAAVVFASEMAKKSDSGFPQPSDGSPSTLPLRATAGVWSMVGPRR